MGADNIQRNGTQPPMTSEYKLLASEVAALKKQFWRHVNNRGLTVPQYDPSDFPGQSVPGQVAIAHPDSSQPMTAWAYDSENGWWQVGTTIAAATKSGQYAAPAINQSITAGSSYTFQKGDYTAILAGDPDGIIDLSSGTTYPTVTADGIYSITVSAQKNSGAGGTTPIVRCGIFVPSKMEKEGYGPMRTGSVDKGGPSVSAYGPIAAGDPIEITIQNFDSTTQTFTLSVDFLKHP